MFKLDNKRRQCVGEWKKVFEPKTKLNYYWNKRTRESTWKEPLIFEQARNYNKECDFRDKYLKHDPLHSLPKGWTRHIDTGSGFPYYWNEFTEEATWIKPEERAKLASGWKPVFDKQRQRYFYFNEKSGEKKWDFPKA